MQWYGDGTKQMELFYHHWTERSVRLDSPMKEEHLRELLHECLQKSKVLARRLEKFDEMAIGAPERTCPVLLRNVLEKALQNKGAKRVSSANAILASNNRQEADMVLLQRKYEPVDGRPKKKWDNDQLTSTRRTWRLWRKSQKAKERKAKARKEKERARRAKVKDKARKVQVWQRNASVLC